MELYTSCSLRLNPETPESKIVAFLKSLFNGELENFIIMDVLEQFREFRADKCYGRLTFNVTAGHIELKEDGIKL